MLRISLPLKSIDTPWKHVRKVSEFSMASVFSAHLLDLLLKMDVFKLLSNTESGIIHRSEGWKGKIFM